MIGSLIPHSLGKVFLRDRLTQFSHGVSPNDRYVPSAQKQNACTISVFSPSPLWCFFLMYVFLFCCPRSWPSSFSTSADIGANLTGDRRLHLPTPVCFSDHKKRKRKKKKQKRREEVRKDKGKKKQNGNRKNKQKTIRMENIKTTSKEKEKKK